MKCQCLALVVASGFSILTGLSSCSRGETPPCDAPLASGPHPREHVQLLVQGVRLHATKTISFDIERIRGELVPTRAGRPPDTEDPTSYVIRLDEALISVGEEAIANDFRDWVLAGTGAPIEGLTVDARDGALRLTGRIEPGIPFDITADVELGGDGKIHVRSRRIETAGVGVKTLSEKTGIGLDRIIGTHEKKGVVVDGNDMTIDVALGFPPPHLDGQLRSVEVVDGALALEFGRSPELSPAGRRRLPDAGASNFIQHFGGTLANGKLVVHGADQRLIDADPSDPFDYSQDLYSRVQLPVSRIEVSPKAETTTIHVPDLDEVDVDRVSGRD